MRVCRSKRATSVGLTLHSVPALQFLHCWLCGTFGWSLEVALLLRRGRTIFALGSRAVVQLLTPHSHFSLRSTPLLLFVWQVSARRLLFWQGDVLLDLHAVGEFLLELCGLSGIEAYCLLRRSKASRLGASVPVAMLFVGAWHDTQILC